MRIGAPSPSATIHQFPTDAVRMAGGSRLARLRAALEPKKPELPPVILGSGWYHEAAIAAERDGKS